MTSADNTTRTLDDALQAAAKACADARLIRASDTKALSDTIATDNAGAAKLLRGSVPRYTQCSTFLLGIAGPGLLSVTV